MVFPFSALQHPHVCLSAVILHIFNKNPQGSYYIPYGLWTSCGHFYLFDTSGLHHPYLLLTLHSYAWHILLILLGVYTGYMNMREVSIRDFAGSTAVYLSCCLIATLCNLAFYPYGTINMFYISPHYQMTQKVFRHIALLLGNNAGIAVYICATVTGACLIHLLWMRIRRA